MTTPPHAPQQAGFATYVKNIVRARIITAMRDMVGRDSVTAPGGGESVYVQYQGEMLEVTVRNVTNQMAQTERIGLRGIHFVKAPKTD